MADQVRALVEAARDAAWHDVQQNLDSRLRIEGMRPDQDPDYARMRGGLAMREAVSAPEMLQAIVTLSEVAVTVTRDGGARVASGVQLLMRLSEPETAATLERLLDQHAQDTPAVRTAYRRAMQLEVGFFDVAWRGA